MGSRGVPSTSRNLSPKLTRDPSLPSSLPTISRDGVLKDDNYEKPSKKTLLSYCYNKENNTCCDRTFKGWIYIIAYGIIYLIFLVTYALIFLFGSLWIVRATNEFQSFKVDLLTYARNGIGLSATPTSESNYPLIWYRKGNVQDQEKYIAALDSLLIRKRRKRDLEPLGPCGKSPYGYGDAPCVLIRVNKQFNWAGKPLLTNSTETKVAPDRVQNWLKQDKKLWLHCSGYHSYDKEHIGIRYFPDPPGFDPGAFPLNSASSPVIAIQILNFTVGISLAVECKLWYVGGPSSISFILYVAPDNALSRTQV